MITVGLHENDSGKRGYTASSSRRKRHDCFWEHSPNIRLAQRVCMAVIILISLKIFIFDI